MKQICESNLIRKNEWNVDKIMGKKVYSPLDSFMF